MKLYDELCARKTELIRNRKRIEKGLNGAPKGSLRISHSGNRILYYWRKESSDRRGIYIGKADMLIAKDLAQKSYLVTAKEAIDKEVSAIDSYLASIPPKTCEDIFETFSETRKQLIKPLWITDEEYAANWISQDYVRKEISEDVPEFYTDKDERVRSKSEVIIANELNKAGVPYKYECPLVINGVKIHPDFTILNVRKKQEIYWEHFGKMDDPDYANKTVSKTNLFLSGGYFLGENFIFTAESVKLPISVKQIRKMIEHYCV